MPMIRRQIVAQITIGGTIVRDFLAVRASHSLANPVATAQVVVPYNYGTYNDPVEIRVGAIPGSGYAARFVGRRRKSTRELYPRRNTIECVGVLSLAAEYLNHEDTLAQQQEVPLAGGGTQLINLGWGGLRVADLVPSAATTGATFTQIAAAVLTRAGVPFTLANLESTGRRYGGPFWDNGWRFIWKAGTAGVGPQGQIDIHAANAGRRAGESALSYLQKYCQIEASYDFGPPRRVGFYRLFELPDGTVVSRLVGGTVGRVISTDPYSGRMLVFTEGGSSDIRTSGGTQVAPLPGSPNILSANFNRDYPLGNRTLVIGYDTGKGYQWHFDAHSQNPFMQGADIWHYDPSPPSSDWIDWQSRGSEAPGGVTSFSGGPVFGMDCETVALARLEEVNRETVSGQLTTADDALIEPGQIHLVQGPYGIADRLGTGETLMVQGVDFDLEVQSGAPVMTQSITYLGGGGRPE